MRLTSWVLLSLLCAAPAVAQPPTPTKQTPPTPTKQTPTKQTPTKQTPPRRASPASTTTMSVSVTDGKGAPIAYVTVRVSGPVDREASTDGNGGLRLEGLPS